MIIEKAKGLIFTSFLPTDTTTKRDIENAGIKIQAAVSAEVIICITDKASGAYLSTVSLIPIKVKTVSNLPEFNNLDISTGDDMFYKYVISFSDVSFINKQNAEAVFLTVVKMFGKELHAERKRLDKIAYANGTKKAPTLFSEGDKTPEKENLLGYPVVDTGSNEFLGNALVKTFNYEKIGEGIYKTRIFFEIYDGIVEGICASITTTFD